jgi:hypothetical protein
MAANNFMMSEIYRSGMLPSTKKFNKMNLDDVNQNTFLTFLGQI